MAKKAKAAKVLKLACAWFAGCRNEAVVAVEHPVLGPVPCCKKCADFATDGDTTKHLTFTVTAA